MDDIARSLARDIYDQFGIDPDKIGYGPLTPDDDAWTLRGDEDRLIAELLLDDRAIPDQDESKRLAA